MASTYKNAGVDIQAGDALVDWLVKDDGRSERRKMHEDKVVSGIGGFAALFRAQFGGMKSPCLVSATDGVGTKVKIAAEFARYNDIGQDLVAMCVNDLVCVGAEPLFFLDYYAAGKLDLKVAKVFLSGVRRACEASGCVLIGGETAEMPGVYQKNDFDCAGFAVGVVDEKDTLGAHKVKLGDCLIGVASSGFHSNGYSLLRKVFAKDIKKWAEVLLRPTHLYVSLVRHIIKEKLQLHAVAHVTGGGLDNLLRVIPDNVQLALKPWRVPDIFHEVKKRAKLTWPEMLRTLNCGIGMVLMVDAGDKSAVMKVVRSQGFQPIELGHVIKTDKKNPKKNWQLDYSRLEK
ncbi:MAG: phosphoribosylformylglycinamidine cyclo-ligase [Bdellovibrionales bacterium RBG_16_40_8]|nr:MAG: phosphoribosylformylglycinamidine cyclo-ligase [Bdellovibrionales bacterium RBG_16_40_8]